jgi:hypothetical protein
MGDAVVIITELGAAALADVVVGGRLGHLRMADGAIEHGESP